MYTYAVQCFFIGLYWIFHS